MPVVIRLVESGDIPAMAAIRARESQNVDFWVDRIGRYLSGEHSPQQALPIRVAFVAMEEGRLVGFVAGHHTRRFDCDGELQWINVVQERRGSGIADQLMQKMGEWFVRQQLVRVCVNVSAENVAARKLYTRSGATALNDHWMIWDKSQTFFVKLDTP